MALQTSRMKEKRMSAIAAALSIPLSVSIWQMICSGIVGGVGSVLSFLPIIVILFLFLSLLEDSGYIARVAFVMDKLLRKIGLSGRSQSSRPTFFAPGSR